MTSAAMITAMLLNASPKTCTMTPIIPRSYPDGFSWAVRWMCSACIWPCICQTQHDYLAASTHRQLHSLGMFPVRVVSMGVAAVTMVVIMFCIR